MKIVLFALSAIIAIGGLYLTKPERPRLAKFLSLIIIFATAIGIMLENRDTKEHSLQQNKAEKAYQKIDEQHSVIMSKDQRISELEKQSNTLRSLEAKLECTFSGNWKDHPSDTIPLGWKKTNAYIQLLHNNGASDSKISFYLKSIDLKKVEDGNLKVVLVSEAQTESQQFGGPIEILKNYNSFIVYIPFVDYNDTHDHKLVLKKVEAIFIVNGSNKVNLNQQVNFDVPIPGQGKLAVFQMNQADLFSGIIS